MLRLSQYIYRLTWEVYHGPGPFVSTSVNLQVIGDDDGTFFEKIVNIITDLPQ
jgi:hypothetical protein